MTVGAALAAARDRLAAAGIADPPREAAELYAAAVCGAVSAAFLDRDRPIAAPVAERLALAAERRAAGWPQGYAAGRVNFRGHWLAVDHRVLIPRSETEGLVQHAIDWAVARGGPPAVVADIGTGSGAIAIALALEAPVAGVIAVDLSADALNVALENAQALGARERISFRRGDLLGGLLDDRVHAVISNPPYVASAEWPVLEPAVRDYEPRLAFDGGADGLELLRRLVSEARGAIEPGGLLAFEVDAGRAEASAALAAAAGFADVRVEPDLFGLPRYVLARA